MSARFDAGGDKLTRTANMPSLSTFTWMGWIYIVSIPSASGGGVFTRGGSDNKAINVVLSQARVLTVSHTDATNSTTGSTLSANTWYHVAIVVTGGNATVYLNGVVDIGPTSMSSPTVDSITMGTLFVSNTFRLDGRMQAVKMWDGVALSALEIQWEMRQHLHVRADSLYANWPLTNHTLLSDIGPNARTLTSNGTLSTEDGPPIPWGEDGPDIIEIAATASAASSAPSITGAATGASLVAAAGSSAPTTTGAATGASLAAAAGSSDPTVTGAATGAALFAGAGSSAPSITGAATGASLAAAAGSSAPSVSADGAGASLAAAAASSSPTTTGAGTGASLAAAAASSAPSVTADAGTASTISSAPSVTGAGTGASLAAAAGSSAPTVTGAATGAALFAGAGNADTSPTVNASGASLAAAAGSSAPTTAGAATGASLAAAAASSAPSVTADATGTFQIAGASAPSSAPTIVVDATGAARFAGAGSSAPTITVDSTAVSLAAGAASCAPTITVGMGGASLFAGAASSAPSIAAGATGAALAAGDASSAPELTGDATSTAAAAGSNASSEPTITADAGGASLVAASASSEPTITVGMSAHTVLYVLIRSLRAVVMDDPAQDGRRERHDISWSMLEDGRLEVEIERQNGDPYDLTGATVEFGLGRPGQAPAIQKVAVFPSASKARFQFTRSEWANLIPLFAYSYDVQLTDVDGKRWQVVPASKWKPTYFKA